MKKYENGIIRDMTEEEERQWIADMDKAKQQDESRPLNDSEVFRLLAAQSINTLSADDNTSLRMISYYPTWEDLCERGYKAEQEGFKFQYAGKLYKTRQPGHTFQSQWIPGEGTSAIYAQVVESHTGTADDPIPVPADVSTNAFTYVTGKIYDEDGTLWLCQRDGEEDGMEHSFTNKPSEVPGYFVKVE